MVRTKTGENFERLQRLEYYFRNGNKKLKITKKRQAVV
jgi:hypothetical protein